MSLKNLKDAELNKLLDEVALDLNKAFGEVQDKLAKGEGQRLEGDQSGKMVKDEVDGKPKAPEESSPVAEGSDAPPAVPPADDGAGSPSPDAAAPAAPGADPAQEMGAQLTPEALEAEYAKLPPEELQMHLQAAQAAAAKMAGGMGAPDAGMGMGAGAPPAPEAAAPQAPLMQSEKAVAADLKKSEELAKAELEAVKAENKSLKEDVEIIAATLKKMIETPVRKAITSIAELQKGEGDETPANDEYKPLAPNEFWAKLKEVSKRPDLKKSEKQLILDVYAKQVNPEVAAKHLARLFKAE